MQHQIMQVVWAFLTILNEMSPYILLGLLFAGALHAFVRQDILSAHLSGTGFKQSLKAALLGVPLPLCSCGVLPVAVSLRRSGASTAATTSFLIATPQTGVDSIVATYSLLGGGFAILRPVAALLTAVGGGCLMSKLAGSDKPCEVDDTTVINSPKLQPTFLGKVREMLRYGFIDMVASVGKWLAIGLAVATLITVLVPQDFFSSFAQYPIVAMLAVVAIAVPMYVCATGSIPVALSLMLKGLTPGVAFVFLMAGPAVNFASYTLLSRAMGRKPTLIYVAIIALSAIAIGLIVDYLLPAAWFIPKMGMSSTCCMHHVQWFNTICSIVLVGLMAYTLLFKQTPKISKSTMTTEYKISGMMCVHCKARVEQAIAQVKGVKSVTVDLSRNVAIVEGEHQSEDIAKCVAAAGYDFQGPIE